MKDLMYTLAGLALVIWPIAAWFTHVIFCFKAGAWGFLVAGAIMFPVAIFHGTWLWF
ncbi:MAG: hypothetical protein JKY14_13760 [Paraglaciecola sp.]|nr:hypothetical protein [Paraglaciecola sp.]